MAQPQAPRFPDGDPASAVMAAAAQARTIAERLGLPPECRIEVVTVTVDLPDRPADADTPYHSALVIDPPIGPGVPDWPTPDPGVHVAVTQGTDEIRVHLPPYLDLADALVLLADRLQEWALEQAHGPALPPCPDHVHPMNAAVVDGVAAWCCPKRPGIALLPIAG